MLARDYPRKDTRRTIGFFPVIEEEEEEDSATEFKDAALKAA